MKLSTFIKKNISPELINGRKIVLFVDCKEKIIADTLTEADTYNKELTAERGCKLLRNESLVVNGQNEIVMHYTATTYKDWCNCGA